MKKYEHIFFDLDKTLWDFTSNTNDTFADLFSHFELKEKGIPSVEILHEIYDKHNDQLWDMYRNGLIEKDFLSVQRYILSLEEFNIYDRLLAETMSKEYLRLSPLKTKLIPGTHEVLEYLHDKYKLHIITNGFNEVQYIKIERSGLKKYFDKVITSEDAGCNKPNPAIFNFALNEANAHASESLMIGDDLEVDILGARKAGMDQLLVNFEKIVHTNSISFEVTSLLEITKIL